MCKYFLAALHTTRSTDIRRANTILTLCRWNNEWRNNIAFIVRWSTMKFRQKIRYKCCTFAFIEYPDNVLWICFLFVNKKILYNYITTIILYYYNNIILLQCSIRDIIFFHLNKVFRLFFINIADHHNLEYKNTNKNDKLFFSILIIFHFLCESWINYICCLVDFSFIF